MTKIISGYSFTHNILRSLENSFKVPFIHMLNKEVLL